MKKFRKIVTLGIVICMLAGCSNKNNNSNNDITTETTKITTENSNVEENKTNTVTENAESQKEDYNVDNDVLSKPILEQLDLGSLEPIKKISWNVQGVDLPIDFDKLSKQTDICAYDGDILEGGYWKLQTVKEAISESVPMELYIFKDNGESDEILPGNTCLGVYEEGGNPHSVDSLMSLYFTDTDNGRSFNTYMVSISGQNVIPTDPIDNMDYGYTNYDNSKVPAAISDTRELLKNVFGKPSAVYVSDNNYPNITDETREYLVYEYEDYLVSIQINEELKDNVYLSYIKDITFLTYDIADYVRPLWKDCKKIDF